MSQVRIINYNNCVNVVSWEVLLFTVNYKKPTETKCMQSDIWTNSIMINLKKGETFWNMSIEPLSCKVAFCIQSINSSRLYYDKNKENTQAN